MLKEGDEDTSTHPNLKIFFFSSESNISLKTLVWIVSVSEDIWQSVPVLSSPESNIRSN